MGLRLVKEDLWRMGFFWWSLALAHMDVTNKDQQTIWKPGDRYYEEVSEISPKPSFWHVLTCWEITTFTSSSVFNYAEKRLQYVHACMVQRRLPWGVVVKDLPPPVVWGLVCGIVVVYRFSPPVVWGWFIDVYSIVVVYIVYNYRKYRISIESVYIVYIVYMYTVYIVY